MSSTDFDPELVSDFSECFSCRLPSAGAHVVHPDLKRREVLRENHRFFVTQLRVALLQLLSGPAHDFGLDGFFNEG